MANRKARAAEVTPLHRVCAGNPIREDFCQQVEAVLKDAREGKVTSMVWVAIGPDFAIWNNAYLAGRSDRMNILGQLKVLTSEIVEQEIKSSSK